MADRLHIRIRPNKFSSKHDVKEMHDKLSEYERRNLRVQFEMKRLEVSEFTPFDHPDEEFEGFKFVHLNTPEALLDEGTNMRHCVGGYADYCVAGESIIFSMRRGDRSFVTIELSGRDLVIKQRYSLNDARIVGSRANEIINAWHNAVVKLNQGNRSYYEVSQAARVRREIDYLEKAIESEQVESLTVTMQSKLKDMYDELREYEQPSITDDVDYEDDTLAGDLTSCRQEVVNA